MFIVLILILMYPIYFLLMKYVFGVKFAASSVFSFKLLKTITMISLSFGLSKLLEVILNYMRSTSEKDLNLESLKVLQGSNSYFNELKLPIIYKFNFLILLLLFSLLTLLIYRLFQISLFIPLKTLLNGLIYTIIGYDIADYIDSVYLYYIPRLKLWLNDTLGFRFNVPENIPNWSVEDINIIKTWNKNAGILSEALKVLKGDEWIDEAVNMLDPELAKSSDMLNEKELMQAQINDNKVYYYLGGLLILIVLTGGVFYFYGNDISNYFNGNGNGNGNGGAAPGNVGAAPGNEGVARTGITDSSNIGVGASNSINTSLAPPSRVYHSSTGETVLTSASTSETNNTLLTLRERFNMHVFGTRKLPDVIVDNNGNELYYRSKTGWVPSIPLQEIYNEDIALPKSLLTIEDVLGSKTPTSIEDVLGSKTPTSIEIGFKPSPQLGPQLNLVEDPKLNQGLYSIIPKNPLRISISDLVNSYSDKPNTPISPLTPMRFDRLNQLGAISSRSLGIGLDSGDGLSSANFNITPTRVKALEDFKFN